jgi:hypothetical protein
LLIILYTYIYIFLSFSISYNNIKIETKFCFERVDHDKKNNIMKNILMG